MGEAEFVAEFRRMANQNHVLFVNERKLVDALRAEVERGDSFINIFHGPDKQLLIMTSGLVAAFKNGTFGLKLQWKLQVSDIDSTRATRRIYQSYAIDELDIYQTPNQTTTFRFGFTNQYDYARADIAESNAAVAAEQLEVILAQFSDTDASIPASDAGLHFDPSGPESSGAAARAAAGQGAWERSFTFYVKAVDQLHDSYVFENFRNRRPGPQDAWLVDGLVESLRYLKDRQPGFDVSAIVREATHRLRTIVTNCDNAGGNSTLYRRGLEGLRAAAPEVDVSDIQWS